MWAVLTSHLPCSTCSRSGAESQVDEHGHWTDKLTAALVVSILQRNAHWKYLSILGIYSEMRSSERQLPLCFGEISGPDENEMSYQWSQRAQLEQAQKTCSEISQLSISRHHFQYWHLQLEAFFLQAKVSNRASPDSANTHRAQSLLSQFPFQATILVALFSAVYHCN